MRILGFDIGSRSIKAVEIDSAFGRYEIHEYHEQLIPPGGDAAQAVSLLMHSLPKPPDRIATCISSSQVTFRNLQLPTRDKKGIIAGVGFELEDELPFASENTVYDYTILSQNKQGTHLHVAASLKNRVSDYLNHLLSLGINPDLLTTEAWAYRGFLNRTLSPTEQEHPVLLVHIGNERTVLYAHLRGTPILTRELAWGGRDLTLAICQKYHLPLDQAEQSKLDRGFILTKDQKTSSTSTTFDEKEFSDTLSEPLQTLLQEIRQVELSCRNLTQENFSMIYLSGGTTQLPGLVQSIEEETDRPTQLIRALSAVTTSGVNYSESADALYLLAVSAALCMIGPERNQCINFRKGEFAKDGQSKEFTIATLRKPILAVSSVLGCLFLSLIIESFVYQSRLKQADVALEKNLKSFFTSISSSGMRTYLSNPSTLTSSINKELEKQREVHRLSTSDPSSPLETLKNLSTWVPKDMVVDMTRYQVGAAPTSSYGQGDHSVSLTFLLSSPQTADRLSSLLIGKIENLHPGKVEPITTPDGKRWKVSFDGKLPEVNYGK